MTTHKRGRPKASLFPASEFGSVVYRWVSEGETDLATAASQLKVSTRTLQRWMRDESLPSEALQQALIGMLSGLAAPEVRTPSTSSGKSMESSRIKGRGLRRSLGHYGGGTKTAWYEAQELTADKRVYFRERALESGRRKEMARAGLLEVVHPVNQPFFDPDDLMPAFPEVGLSSLSLFSGGGGLDLGFERAGYTHVAGYEVLTDACTTLRQNRPHWKVYGEEEGDVRRQDWRNYKGEVDVIHGGPPCQPFSIAGRRMGEEDERNLLPEFVRAVREVAPRAFLMENVPSLQSARFENFLKAQLFQPLGRRYVIESFIMDAGSFGVPQKRKRVFFVGVRKDLLTGRKETLFAPPPVTHSTHIHKNGSANSRSMFGLETELLRCIGVRKALGLPDIGYDDLAPTLRSGLTGPRHTTSINNSVASLKAWGAMMIWPHGVAATPEEASSFPPENLHFRLSVRDCALLQGFPQSWRFHGAVYMAIGQIGNSVSPPVAYQVARAIARWLKR